MENFKSCTPKKGYGRLQEAEVNTRGFNYSETSIKRMPSIKRTLIKPGPEINVLYFPL